MEGLDRRRPISHDRDGHVLAQREIAGHVVDGSRPRSGRSEKPRGPAENGLCRSGAVLPGMYGWSVAHGSHVAPKFLRLRLGEEALEVLETQFLVGHRG